MTERLTQNNFRLGFDDSNKLPGYEAIYEKIRKYENAEEEGRLVVLPCKVGEKIYAIYTGITGKNPTIMRTSFDYGLIPYFGKSVFLSYEEAEKALEEMEGNHE